MPGRSVSGSIALALMVLINDTASAPPSSAATATAAGSATLGVSFTISGLAVRGRSASTRAAVSTGCSPTISPEWTFGQETLSSIPATSSRSSSPSTSRPKPSRLVAMAETISGTGSSASLGRSSARKPSSPLFGRPIELIIPAGVSQIRWGSLPARGSGVIVFETKAEKGKSSSSSSPKTWRAATTSKVPEALITGWASSMPQKSGMRHLRDGVAADDRPVDAEPHVAAARLRHRAAEAGAEAAGHRRLHRQLAGDPVLGAEAADRLEHCRWAAGVDDGGGGVVAGQNRRQEVGDVALVTGVAV